MKRTSGSYFQLMRSYSFLFLIVVLVFISSITLAMAQSSQYQAIKGVKFKDGTVILGTVTQLNVETVTIRLDNGQTVVRKFDDVDTFIKRDDAVKTYQETKPAAPPAAFVAPAAVPMAAPTTTAPATGPATPTTSPAASSPAAAPATVTNTISTPTSSRDTQADQMLSPQVATETPASSEPVILPHRRGYFALGGGSGGDTDSSSGRMEGGYFTVNNELNYLLGIGLTVTFERSETPSDVLDYSVPHADYRNLGWKKDGEEWGFYVKFGLEPIKGSGIYLLGLGGFTLGREILLARSNVTGWYYTQAEDTNMYGLLGGGIGFFGSTTPLSIQVTYDNRMGTTGMIGFAW